MKKIIEKQKVFNWILKFLSFLSNWSVTEGLIPGLTGFLAKINLLLNQPSATKDLTELAKTWKKVMPPDGQENFVITEVTTDTAFVEIHLHCPLRGTGKVDTCFKFMNYDRTLMKKVGGSVTVLESQSNSGKDFCKLAIRRAEDSIGDITPAHLKG